MRVSVDLSEPWDWNPPVVEIEIDDNSAPHQWPKLGRITAISAIERARTAQHPRPEVFVPSAVIGRSVSLRLRHTHAPGASPSLLDAPTVYVTLDPEDPPSHHLIGYGVLRAEQRDGSNHRPTPPPPA